MRRDTCARLPRHPDVVRTAIDSCGTRVEVPRSAPQRIVAIKTTSTELLLALGLGDRIVGSAFQNGRVPAEFTSAAASMPVTSDFAPSRGSVLDLDLDVDLDLDFEVARWKSMLTPDLIQHVSGVATTVIAGPSRPLMFDLLAAGEPT